MKDSERQSLVVQRRRLRAGLRQARLDAGLAREQAASAMDWSTSRFAAGACVEYASSTRTALTRETVRQGGAARVLGSGRRMSANLNRIPVRR